MTVVRADASAPPHRSRCRSPVVDNHCHLDIAGRRRLAATSTTRSRRAAAVGVPRIVQIGCDLPGARWAVEAAERVRRARGRRRPAPERGAAAAMRAASSTTRWPRSSGSPADPRVRAVGETGLDYYRTGPEGVAAQETSFARTSSWPSGTARRWSSTTATPTTTCCAMLDEPGSPSGRCSTASPATRTWLGRASTAAA